MPQVRMGVFAPSPIRVSEINRFESRLGPGDGILTLQGVALVNRSPESTFKPSFRVKLTVAHRLSPRVMSVTSAVPLTVKVCSGSPAACALCGNASARTRKASVFNLMGVHVRRMFPLALCVIYVLGATSSFVHDFVLQPFNR